MLHMASSTSFESIRETKAEKTHIKCLREDRVCVPLFRSLMIFSGGCWNDSLNLYLCMDGVCLLRELLGTCLEDSLFGVSKTVCSGGLSRSWAVVSRSSC